VLKLENCLLDGFLLRLKTAPAASTTTTTNHNPEVLGCEPPWCQWLMLWLVLIGCCCLVVAAVVLSLLSPVVVACCCYRLLLLLLLFLPFLLLLLLVPLWCWQWCNGALVPVVMRVLRLFVALNG